MKKYMVIEKYKLNCYDRIYQRFNEKGRLLPAGLNYLNSWVNREQSICYQLMETNDEQLFPIWVNQWKDLVDFEIVPID